MKIRAYICCLLCTCGSFAFGQSETLRDVQTLEQKLKEATQDSTKSLLLAQLCEAYRWSNPDSAYHYGQKALMLARSISFPKGEVRARNGLSVVKRELGLVPDAIDEGLKALRISESLKNDPLIYLSKIRIANAYNEIANYEKALEYYRFSMSKSFIDNNKILAEAYLLLMAHCYADYGLLDSAEITVSRSLTIGSEINAFSSLLFDTEAKIAEIQGDYDKAIASYDLAIKYSSANENQSEMAASFIEKAKIYEKLKMPDAAVANALKSEQIGKLLDHPRLIIDASQILARIYESIDPKKSIYYHNQLLAAKDTLSKFNQIQSFQNVVLRDRENQEEIKKAEEELIVSVKLYSLIAGIIVFSFIALILYRNNRNKQRAFALLQQQKVEIDSQKNKAEQALTELKSTQSQLIQSEKMASLGELTAGIAHEIQNPLNFVNNFSELNKELIAELKEAVANNDQQEIDAILNDLEGNEDKVTQHGKRAEQIVRAMLQHSKGSEGKKEPTDLNALCDEYLRLAYHGMRAKDNRFNAEFKLNLDPALPNLEVVPQDIGRVLLNLINNAFQAVADVEKPEVAVATKWVSSPSGVRGSEGNIQITVSDNGTGIPDEIKDKIFQPFFTTKPTGQGTGLGLSLSYDIVKAHGGELKVENVESYGAKFTIKLMA